MNQLKKIKTGVEDKLSSILIKNGYSKKRARWIIIISINIGWPMPIPFFNLITGIIGIGIAIIYAKLRKLKTN